MAFDQFTKILLSKDFVTSDGSILKKGFEVSYEDWDGDLVVISYKMSDYEFGELSFAGVTPDFLEEVTYGVISRQPFTKK